MNLRSARPLIPRHRDATVRSRLPWLQHHKLAIGASAVAFAFVAVTAVAPPAPATAKELLDAYNRQYAQTVTVLPTVVSTPVARDDYSTSPGIPQLARHGTNYDWAKIVLMKGGWPVTENNVTVITRWMRQENGPNNWWNRNNPLNNGWGSGGGGGTGSYVSLLVAAENAAAALHGHSGYAAIIAAFAADAPTDVTERAIWASPWASGHYANGAHWHYSSVTEFTAPVGAWG
ncbi:MAG: hypothetical protein IT190_03650 [Microbacteriaceae bacterium]|nr:hypothetical protein [Microbacteriaceae bacterium]